MAARRSSAFAWWRYDAPEHETNSTDFLINPVLQLLRRQQVAEVRCIPGDQKVVASNGLSCDKDISATFWRGTLVRFARRSG
jgi:hypothetical protein